MKNKYIVIALLCCFTLVGCSDKLDITNPNSPTEDVFFKNLDDGVESVNAIYSRLNHQSPARHMPWLGNLRSDEMFSKSPAVQMVNNYDLFVITDYNWGQIYTIWQTLYVMIFRANQALEGISTIPVDEGNATEVALKARLVGEAYFLRAWAYYHLALYWGNVPLMLKPSSADEKGPTTQQKDVYAQVLADLEVAEMGLGTKGDYIKNDSGANIGRATKGAARAIMAKVYMQIGEYDQALSALEWMVEGAGAGDYELVKNYQDNFLMGTENNSESVFEYQSTRNENQNHQNDINDPDKLNLGNSSPKFYAPKINGVGFADLEVNLWVRDELLKEKTASGGRDPRVSASFLYKDTDERGADYTLAYGVVWSTQYPDPTGYDHNRVYLRKWLNDTYQNFEDYASPNNYRQIRYADVLLMYAECLNNEGRTADAYEWVNKVRNRAGLKDLEDAYPEIGNDKAKFLEQLKHERVTELAGEGHRWGDLLRWGDLGTGLKSRDAGFANFVVGKHELLPIPQTDLDFNPNLDQNPNW